LRRAIRLAAVLLVACASVARAGVPPLADVDAHARAAGNDKPVAIAIGEKIFATPWPVQVMEISANDMNGHVVVGMRLSGVKFHGEPTRGEFNGEIIDLVTEAFAAAPLVEEIDLWVTVPIRVGKDAVVSGDLAVPTARNVFTLSARRAEPRTSLEKRLAAGTNIFVDEEWARTAFKQAGT
jgi:hypothetical protein